MIKAVIFDLEGTLLSTRECRIRAWMQTAREQGIQCDEKMLCKMAHARAPQALEIMLTRSRRTYQPPEKMALLARQSDLLEAELTQHQGELLLPNAVSIVEGYRASGLITAAVSAVSDADSLLRRLQIRSLFDTSAGELSSAAKHLHVDCSECLAVSVSEETLREAQRLGMQCTSETTSIPQPVFTAKD